MRRNIPGLAAAAQRESEIPNGLYLFRVEHAQHRWAKQKPFYSIRLKVVEPALFAGRTISGRLYCTAKALWKLSWFLRDFGYDPELLGLDELDEEKLVGLQGVVKVSHATVSGRSVVNLEGFAPAAQWEELNTGRRGKDAVGAEVA